MKKSNVGALNTFLKTISNLPKPDNSNQYVRFYRGQNVENSPLPTLFRNPSYELNEDSMFYDVINRKPEEFSKCMCAFDFLVKMQHYELPTRLLDITSNPLVALYFACTGEPIKQNKRTVFCIDVPKCLIKNFNSDSVAILSNFARCDFFTKSRLKQQVIELNKLIQAYISFIKDVNKDGPFCFEKKFTSDSSKVVNDFININEDSYMDYYMFYSAVKDKDCVLDNFKEIMKNSPNKTLEYAVYSVFCNIKSARLLHEIKQDKPYFRDEMKLGILNNILCVIPKLDNPRIIAQKGAFLIFPFKMFMSSAVKVNTIHIAPNGVKRIKGQLEQLDIKEDTLFNELDKVCNSIKNKYKDEHLKNK